MSGGPDPFLTMVMTLAVLQGAAQAAPPPAREFCGDLRQVVAAAREAQPFESLENVREDRWLGGIASCRRIIDHGPFWRCVIPINAVPDGIDGLADRTARCLPRAERTEHVRRPEASHDRAYSAFRLGRTTVGIRDYGGPGMHQGWYYLYTVTVRR